MTKTIAFFPHNSIHNYFFAKVGKLLNREFNYKVIYISEFKSIEGQEVFHFEKSIEKIWDEVDVSYSSLCKLQNKYPNSNLMRALYSERRYNFFPKYFNNCAVPYERQLRYLVACFIVFEKFLVENNVDYIVSELLIGLPDSVLYEICKKEGIQFLSLRPSKIFTGVIKCDPECDLPEGMLEVYRKFLRNGIPQKWYELATSHIRELRSRIMTPAYMEFSKREFSLIDIHRVPFLLSKLGKSKMLTNSISMTKHPIIKSVLWHFHRFINIWRTKINKSRWFLKEISPTEKYFIFPLQYEPESSTLVRAFPFSDQVCIIQQVAKLLPLGVTLLVKEHRGNHGYRKASCYKELHYLPNVKLISRESDVFYLIRNCIGVITLTSRMGWEALVFGKPVITFGSAFWTFFKEVKKPESWINAGEIINECVANDNNDINQDYEKRLLAYASAYISLIHEANFVTGSKDFMTEENARRIANVISADVYSP